MTIGQWFGFQGRIGRKTWWLGYVLPLVGLSIVATALDVGLGFVTIQDAAPVDGYGVETGGIGVFGLLSLVPMIWGGLAGQVKRWHDRDKSGWFVLVNFIPFIGAIWALVELGFLRGTAGPNRFGPDPLGGGYGPPHWQQGYPPPQQWQQPGQWQQPQQPQQPQWPPPPAQGWQPPPQQPQWQPPPQGPGQPPPGYGQSPQQPGQWGGQWGGPGQGGSVPPVRRD